MFDSDNRWVLFPSLMPCVELEEAYAPQFSPRLGLLQNLYGLHWVLY